MLSVQLAFRAIRFDLGANVSFFCAHDFLSSQLKKTLSHILGLGGVQGCRFGAFGARDPPNHRPTNNE
jgi:hypothetical protein